MHEFTFQQVRNLTPDGRIGSRTHVLNPGAVPRPLIKAKQVHSQTALQFTPKPLLVGPGGIMVFRNSARSILKPTLLVATVMLNSDANGGRVAPNVGRTVAPEASDDFYQASQ